MYRYKHLYRENAGIFGPSDATRWLLYNHIYKVIVALQLLCNEHKEKKVSMALYFLGWYTCNHYEMLVIDYRKIIHLFSVQYNFFALSLLQSFYKCKISLEGIHSTLALGDLYTYCIGIKINLTLKKNTAHYIPQQGILAVWEIECHTNDRWVWTCAIMQEFRGCNLLYLCFCLHQMVMIQRFVLAV